MSDKFYNIPDDLRKLNQWCLWRFEDIGADKPTKVPYSKDHKKLNVNDENAYLSFQEAMNIFNIGNYSGIGFVFAQGGNIAGIDLDDPEGDSQIYERQLKIFHEFDSYSELSPSGKGVHIIIKGSVLSGRRKKKIEIYSSGRFFTMTGDVYADKPIAYRQELLTQLWEQMGGPTVTSTFTGED